MRRHAGRQPHLLPRARADQEVTAFVPVIDGLRALAMVCLLRYAGLRVGEVAALQVADLTVPDAPHSTPWDGQGAERVAGVSAALARR